MILVRRRSPPTLSLSPRSLAGVTLSVMLRVSHGSIGCWQALGVDTGETPMSADQAQQVADWLGNTRWDRIARTLAAMEQSQCDTPPPAKPEISIAAGSGVSEGSEATFTVTASPTPATALTVNVMVSQSGSFGASTGADTVTIPTTGSATYTVSTTNDSTDEPDGSVTATLSTGTGYTVSGTNNAATVAVSDDDDPPPASPTLALPRAVESPKAALPRSLSRRLPLLPRRSPSTSRSRRAAASERPPALTL